VKRIIEFCKTHNGITNAAATAQSFADKAKSNLKIFPDNEYREAAENFVDYVLSRKK